MKTQIANTKSQALSHNKSGSNRPTMGGGANRSRHTANFLFTAMSKGGKGGITQAEKSRFLRWLADVSAEGAS